VKWQRVANFEGTMQFHRDHARGHVKHVFFFWEFGVAVALGRLCVVLFTHLSFV